MALVVRPQSIRLIANHIRIVIRLQHDNLGANTRTIVEINYVLVGQANTTGGNVLADGPRLVRAVDPIEGVFVSLPQIQSTGAKWVGRSADHS
jgi:hypothetical protein